MRRRPYSAFSSWSSHTSRVSSSEVRRSDSWHWRLQSPIPSCSRRSHCHTVERATPRESGMRRRGIPKYSAPQKVQSLRGRVGHSEVGRPQTALRAGQSFRQELDGISEHDVLRQHLRAVAGSTRRLLQAQRPTPLRPSDTQQHSLHHQADRSPSCLHVGSSSGEMECPRYTRKALRARLKRFHGRMTSTIGLSALFVPLLLVLLIRPGQVSQLAIAEQIAGPPQDLPKTFPGESRNTTARGNTDDKRAFSQRASPGRNALDQDRRLPLAHDVEG